MTGNTRRDRTVIREAVGIFHDGKHLQAAVDDLLSAGFDRAELTMLAGEASMIRELGHGYRRVEALADDARTPRAAYVSTESIGDAEGGLIGGLMYLGATAAAGAVVASGGTLAGAALAAALLGGAGGALGAALARLVDLHHADHLARQVEAGGLLLWVSIRDVAHEARAQDILRRHGATEVHLHDLVAGRYLEARPGVSDLERALLDPTSVFRRPEEVLARQDLSRDQKAAILQRWRYDAFELEVAETEGMGGGEPDLLSRVLDALRAARKPRGG